MATKTTTKTQNGDASTNGHAPRRKRSPMSDEHKAQLDRGRRAGTAVKHYLLALEERKPKRGRGTREEQMSTEAIHDRLAAIDDNLKVVGIMEKLPLLAEQERLVSALQARDETGPDMETLEKGFIEYGREWCQTKGYSYTMMRVVGVPADVLKRAGIERS